MILLNDFKSHYDAVRDEIRPAVDRVLESAWYILGEELQAVEQAFSKYIGAAYAVGVASGTDAIALALMAAEIGDGDEVITSNMTAFPTITGITMTGAVPVVVDIDPATGLLDPAAVEAAITPRSRAVVPVHLYGQSCDMDAITALTQAHRISVIEDCAQSVGATCRGKTTGTIGKLGCFSFYPTKNLGAFGDAGAVVTSDANLHEQLLQLRNYGQSRRYYHASQGINSRLDEIQAAILNVKLKHLERWTARRRKIAARYRELLPADCLLTVREYGEPVYHLFPIKVKQRDAFIEHMRDSGVQTLIHYPVPVHRQEAFKRQKHQLFDATDAFAAEIVSLPIHPELTDAEVEQVAAAAGAGAGYP